MTDMARPQLMGRRWGGIISQSDPAGGIHGALSHGHGKKSPLGPHVGQTTSGRLANQDGGELENN